jgi:hypothetical protein
MRPKIIQILRIRIRNTECRNAANLCANTRSVRHQPTCVRVSTTSAYMCQGQTGISLHVSGSVRHQPACVRVSPESAFMCQGQSGISLHVSGSVRHQPACVRVSPASACMCQRQQGISLHVSGSKFYVNPKYTSRTSSSGSTCTASKRPLRR